MPENKSAVGETVTVDKSTMQSVLDYLSQKPYGEVHVLVGALAQSIQRHALINQMAHTNSAAAAAANGVVAEPAEEEPKTRKRGRPKATSIKAGG